MKTLLEIIQTAQAELGLPQATTVIGNTDPTTAQMLAFANAELDELRQSNESGWTALQFEFNLVVQVPLNTTGNVTINSPIITNIPNTSTLSANNFYVSGSYIPQGARILSVDSATQVTLTMEATGTEVGSSLNFARDTYPIPTDLDWFQNNTWWDRTNRWQLVGPDSPQQSQFQLSGIVATGPRRHFRQIGPYSSDMRLWPAPAEISNPLQLVWEYMSNNGVRVNGSATNFSRYFANDNDTPILDDRSIILGIKWRFWEQKGFNWVAKKSEYDSYVNRLQARDGASPTLNLVKSVYPLLITPANVQDGYFPGPVGPNMS